MFNNGLDDGVDYSVTGLVKRGLRRLGDSDTPGRDMAVGIGKALGLVFRAPDGVLFRRIAWNSPRRSSSDYSYLFKLENKIRNVFRLGYNFNFSKIEIELTTLCNLHCNNCDRSSGQAVSSESMSLDQIKRFLDESVRNGKKWRKILIQGGEPLLHPQIHEALALFVEYKKNYSPGTFIRITTNGSGPKVQKVIESIPQGIHFMNTAKVIDDDGHLHVMGRPEGEFDTYHIAPVDVAEYKNFTKRDFRKGCSIPEGPGMGLTRYGYFPCGAGASVARVFGQDVGVKSLDRVTRRKFRKALESTCQYCGHFKANGRQQRPTSVPVHSSDQITSVTWHGAFGSFRQKKEKLTLY